MQWKGGQDAEYSKVRASRTGGVVHLSPPTISATPKGNTLNLQEWRAILSCSQCTFPLINLSLREAESYSQHPGVTGKGGRSLLQDNSDLSAKIEYTE